MSQEPVTISSLSKPLSSESSSMGFLDEGPRQSFRQRWATMVLRQSRRGPRHPQDGSGSWGKDCLSALGNHRRSSRKFSWIFLVIWHSNGYFAPLVMRTFDRRILSTVAIACFGLVAVGQTVAQQGPPPLPTVQKSVRPPPGYAARLMTNRPPVVVTTPQPVTPQVPGSPTSLPLPSQPPYIAIAPSVTQLQALPDKHLAWDAESKEYSAKLGETNAHFTFSLTNISAQEILINSVRTSCGCTVAQMPAQPWHLGPGTNGPISVTVDLRNKFGSIVKSVTVDSSIGIKTLIVRVNVPSPDPAAGAGSGDMDRLRNMQLTMADRQVVFRNDCAKCHAEPAHGKMGKELYQAACAICHDSPHRATMVPDLKALKHPTNADHWRTWTASGRVGTMMPAFAKAQGGPLTDEQITSLVQYLTQTIPSTPAATAAASASPTGTQSEIIELPRLKP